MTKRAWIIVVIVGLLVLLALPKLWPSGEDAAAAGPPRNAPLSVQVHVVEPQVLRDRIVATGTVRANEEVELRSEVAGRVEQILFEEGRAVQQGAVLVKINDDDLRARLAQVQHRLELAANRARRQELLLEKGGVSKEEFEATASEVAVLESEADLIEVQIEKTRIRAPFSGIVGLRHVSVGSYLSPNTALATITDVDPAKVEFSIPERYAPRLSVGDEIVFQVEGVDGAFRGTIYAFEPSVDENTRTLRVRARSPNGERRLLPGAFANIELIFREIDDALAVPAIAIIPELGGKKVFVLEDGKASPRPVETGIRTEDRVQVTDGLAPGDTVIVTGIQQLRPGLPVRVTGAGVTVRDAEG